MSAGSNPFHPSAENLSESLPIFPLTGVLLLPRRQLPLNIFEPRYLNMVFDALAADRTIGMIQPDPARSAGGDAVVYNVGCAGRVTRFNETDDGRLLINLTGVCRFVLVQEVAPVRGYRKVIPDWSAYLEDLEEAAAFELDRKRLEDALRAYFSVHSIQVDWDALMDMPDAALVDFLAMNLPFASQEKQALLEAQTLSARAGMLMALSEMAASGADSETATKH